MLQSIEDGIKKNYLDIFVILPSGEMDEDILILKDKVFLGVNVPKDLEALYSWHNGDNSLSPEA